MITLKEIARRYGVSIMVARWAMTHYGPEPRDRIGTANLWTDADIPAIEAALLKTAKRSPDPKRRQQALEAAQ